MGQFMHCSIIPVLVYLGPFILGVIVQNCESNISRRRRIVVRTFVFIFSAVIVPCAKSIVSFKIEGLTCLLVKLNSLFFSL
jgi:hypothetical protein